MPSPYFVTLAQIDREHFVAACRHGLVHLTWGRLTLRFSQDELRRLASLLQRGAHASWASLRDDDLFVTTRPGEDCELRLGSVVLLLPLDELHQLARALQDAWQRLEQFLASGGFGPEPDEPRQSFLDQLRRTSFSNN